MVTIDADPVNYYTDPDLGSGNSSYRSNSFEYPAFSITGTGYLAFSDKNIITIPT